MKKAGCLLLSVIMLLIPMKCNADSTYIKEEYQEYVYEIADTYNICPEIIIAMIEKESSGRAEVVSDGGCVGLMQIQPKFHKDRMERLGVTDLTDAYSNILVGCDFIAELAEKHHEINVVLTAYNAGEYSESVERAKNGEWSAYAKRVTARSEELERIRENGISNI